MSLSKARTGILLTVSVGGCLRDFRKCLSSPESVENPGRCPLR
jgi:hypothetical protein